MEAITQRIIILAVLDPSRSYWQNTKISEITNSDTLEPNSLEIAEATR
jgi:hypothetical protein